MKTTAKIELYACPYCGHGIQHSVEACPRIKTIEYFADGRVKRVEKMTPADFITKVPLSEMRFT